MKSRPAHPMVLSAALFTWTGKAGAAFASDLPEHYYGRVWDDSPDFGFFCRSPKTGVVVTFVEGDVILDREGSVAGRKYHAEGDLDITIFNT